MDLAQATHDDSLQNLASVVDKFACTGVKTKSDLHELRHALSNTCVSSCFRF